MAEEIEEIVYRIDFSWDQSFLAPDEYIEKRQQFQREIESLCQVDYNDLMEAVDLLGDFNQYLPECENVGAAMATWQQLIAKIVKRIFVYDGRVISIALYGDLWMIPC